MTVKYLDPLTGKLRVHAVNSVSESTCCACADMFMARKCVSLLQVFICKIFLHSDYGTSGNDLERMHKGENIKESK